MINKETHTNPDKIDIRVIKRGGNGYSKHRGYINVYKPSHPYACGNGYVKEHRLVMECYLDRYLEVDEIIHHVNGNKEDNNISNLQITNMAEHRAIHNAEDKKGVLHFNEEKVRELYNQGYSARSVANTLGMGKSTVAQYIKRMGISRPRMSNRDDRGKFKRRIS